MNIWLSWGLGKNGRKTANIQNCGAKDQEKMFMTLIHILSWSKCLSPSGVNWSASWFHQGGPLFLLGSIDSGTAWMERLVEPLHIQKSGAKDHETMFMTLIRLLSWSKCLSPCGVHWSASWFHQMAPLFLLGSMDSSTWMKRLAETLQMLQRL